jgi:hypothetical protein
MTTASLRCRIGWHRWKEVHFRSWSFPLGRMCTRCGRTQMLYHSVLLWGSQYFDTNAKPKKDAHGYY